MTIIETKIKDVLEKIVGKKDKGNIRDDIFEAVKKSNLTVTEAIKVIFEVIESDKETTLKENVAELIKYCHEEENFEIRLANLILCAKAYEEYQKQK